MEDKQDITKEDLEYLLNNDDDFKHLYFSVLDNAAKTLDVVIKSRSSMILDEFLKDIPIVDNTVSVIDLQLKLIEYKKEEHPSIVTLLDMLSKVVYGETVTGLMENYNTIVDSLTTITESVRELRSNDDNEDEE